MDDIDHIQQRDDIRHQLSLMKRNPTLVSPDGQYIYGTMTNLFRGYL
ncbi:hypothetical protein I6L80_15685 [Providencia rettgeri]|uniref:Uncharacterized protein n=1 Tax=Providencia rettgeri TaxID=587 RepID=A0A379FTM4_PRORE|nr:hypothetical protein [Providencia rettgeri]QXB04804.1 hypothetical protein I6L80_15685 [Providencia rettgeri]SUC32109.1 Uncharacterised protein [Providencia rettgeri]